MSVDVRWKQRLQYFPELKKLYLSLLNEITISK